MTKESIAFKHLRIGSSCVRLEWDESIPDSFAGLLYAPWETTSGEPECTVSIINRDDQYHIDSPNASFIENNLGNALANLEYAITLLAQDLLSDFLQIHASCFGFNGKSVLAVGGHGTGKTTLALTAIASDCYALSDDICVIGHDNRSVHAFPRPFKATDDTWRMSPRPVPEECPHYYTVPDITYVFFHEPPAQFYQPESELAYLLFPVRCPEATSLSELGETEALGRLLQQGFNFTQFGDIVTVHRLLDLIRNTRSYELRYSDNWDAVKVIRDLLTK